MPRIKKRHGLLTIVRAQTHPETEATWASLVLIMATSCLLVALAAFGLRLIERIFIIQEAGAATLTYHALIESVSAPTILTPGQASQVTVKVKNTGTATWLKTGTHFFSLYRYDAARKVETTSVFSTTAWNTAKRPTLLPVASVKPGQFVTFTFPIQAPKTAGSYREDFILCVERLRWLTGGKFNLAIQVGAPVVVAPVVITPTPTPAPTVIPPAVATEPAVIPTSSEWSAQVVDKGGIEWQMEPAQHVVVNLAFKNTGTKTWTRNGSDYVSVYAVDGTKERKSVFKDTSWISDARAVKLKEEIVKPGEVGHFVLELRGPQMPGKFAETFALAAENTAWIYGSQLTLPINIPLSGDFFGTAPVGSDPTRAVEQPVAANDGRYAATLLLRSAEGITLLGNGRLDLTFGFKNSGKLAWGARGLKLKSVTPLLANNLSSVRDESWSSATEPVRLTGITYPGEVGFLAFKIKAPTKRGTYLANFQLFADNNQLVEGGLIDIPITVTADGYIPPASQQNTTPSQTPTQSAQPPVLNFAPINGDTSALPNEPMIRVGLFKTTDDRSIFRAKFGPVSVIASDGSTVCRLALNDSATVLFDRASKTYRLSGGCSGESSGLYRFKSDDGISPIEIADFLRPVSGYTAHDNTFRAQLELRYTPQTDSVWVINELPIEWYLKGIGETSNASHPEFQRTLLTAARTFAMYHVQRGTKHANESFTVDAALDQVYRGYGAETRNPNVVAAINATRGQIVTYQGRLALTPYFSRSDGRTRTWSEVWGGEVAWCVSVPVPWDQGKTLWGHGVGMSATGALSMANDGRRYDEILRYFFTGIEIRVVYK
ncbi:MAG: NBR1-Ig-like domain-containing protein [bacterium]|nr:NBR1-Ig-like domain-containing protein [bacterium]